MKPAVLRIIEVHCHSAEGPNSTFHTNISTIEKWLLKVFEVETCGAKDPEQA